LQDLGFEYYVVAESFETSVPWDRYVMKRLEFLINFDLILKLIYEIHTVAVADTLQNLS